MGVLAGFMDSVISDLQDAREKPHDPRDMPRDDAFIHTYTYVIPSEFPFRSWPACGLQQDLCTTRCGVCPGELMGTGCAAVMHSASRPRP